MLERFAIHKLIVDGVRPIRERTKSAKDLLHAAAIVELSLESGRRTNSRRPWTMRQGAESAEDKGH
jgi:hypothetical protein